MWHPLDTDLMDMAWGQMAMALQADIKKHVDTCGLCRRQYMRLLLARRDDD